MNSAPFHDKLARPSLMRSINSPCARSSGPAGDVPAPRQMDFHIVKPDPLFNVSDLAEEWGCGERHILDLIDEGVVFAFFINAEDDPKHAHYRIPREAAVKGTRLTLAGMQNLVATVDAWLLPVERFGRRHNFAVRDCEAALRVSARHVRELYDAGQLGGQNLGLGRKELSLRIPRAELAAFVQRRLKLTNNL